MASFQLDFKNDIKSVFKMVEMHKGSKERLEMLENASYYHKENATIMALPDRTYWSDRILRNSAGEICYDDHNQPKRISGEVKNPFVSNNRIPYGIFADIVNQKVNTLLDEAPMITGHEFESKFKKQLGFALKKAGIEASICKKAFIFQAFDGKMIVFDSANCIPFYDDTTGALRAFIRYWQIDSAFGGDHITMVEMYEEDGLTAFSKKNTSQPIVEKPKTAYSYKVRGSAVETQTEIMPLGRLPIVEFKNNDDNKSDLTSSLRAKIDAIDLVQSGFVNNIEDFSDIFWVVKTANGAMDSDYYEDFIANINKTKRIFAEQATPEQFQIPHEARSRLVEIFKQEIVEESGVIDTQSLTATALTTVAIKASTMKLRQRVSDFEWQAHNATEELVLLYQAYNGLQFDFEITFTELLIDNDTELLDNMVKAQDLMSIDDKLAILKRVGLIADIEETKKALEEESSYKLADEPIDTDFMFGGVGDAGQGA